MVKNFEGPTNVKHQFQLLAKRCVNMGLSYRTRVDNVNLHRFLLPNRMLDCSGGNGLHAFVNHVYSLPYIRYEELS